MTSAPSRRPDGRLFHFSEEPAIDEFVPRSPLARPEVEPMVWAIDEWHSVMYLLPRDCPRACFWPGAATSEADRDTWFGAVDGRMVIAIEATWLDHVRATTVYRYDMPTDSFSLHDEDGGHWVSRETMKPLAIEPITDLLAAITSADVELRITPSLIRLWQRVIASTLSYSGTRLRNARGWDPGLFGG